MRQIITTFILSTSLISGAFADSLVINNSSASQSSSSSSSSSSSGVSGGFNVAPAGNTGSGASASVNKGQLLVDVIEALEAMKQKNNPPAPPPQQNNALTALQQAEQTSNSGASLPNNSVVQGMNQAEQQMQQQMNQAMQGHPST